MNRLFACILLAAFALTGVAFAAQQSQEERARAAYASQLANDFAAAFREYDALAKEGYVPAYPFLAGMYSHGQGVAVSKMLARHWYSLGAENNDLVSLYNMGIFSDVGIGGARDLVAALGYYRRAAALGDSQAAFNAGQMLLTGEGVDVDLAAGAALIQTAADAGVGNAQLTLGYMHDVGMGVPVSFAKTEQYYRAALNGGEVEAEARSRLWDFEDNMIARGNWLIENGRPGEASDLFDQLCGVGNGDGCYNLGRQWITGANAQSPNYTMALPNFRRGCGLNSYYACQGVAYATVLSPATPSTEDRDRAAKFFSDACDFDEQDKCMNLAYMKYYRRFGMYDYEGAKTLLMNACLNRGYQTACQAFYDIQNAETANRNPAAAASASRSDSSGTGFLDVLGGFFEVMGNYSGGGGGYNSGSYSGGSSSSYSSSSSAQDTADFNNFINSVSAIGTGYNSSCRPGNPYC